MIKVNHDFQKMLKRLALGEKVRLPFDGSDIMIRFAQDASKLSLITAVYTGVNYIPGSVRRCLSEKGMIKRTGLPTYLTVDEQAFQVSLNYFGNAEAMSPHAFADLLEQFGEVARQWRHILDEHDRNDLVHVRHK